MFYPGDRGGWRIWGFAVEPRTLTPLSDEANIYTRWVTQGAIFESLLVYDHETLELKPALAESYEVSDDGFEITFTLRDDIYFSDGAAVTTDDVIFTYETITDPQVDAPGLADLFVDDGGHFTVLGNEFVGESVAEYLQKEGLLLGDTNAELMEKVPL